MLKLDNNETNVDVVMSTIKQNMEQNIIPLIKDNPSVQFNIFFPPFSILYWHYRIENGIINQTFEELEYLITELLNYENVDIFYFQNIKEIITDLDRYKDYSHYEPEINDYITECFANGKHRLTKENYIDEIEKMKILALNFDYDGILILD